MLHNYLQDVDALNIDRPALAKDMSTDYIRQVLEEIIQGMSSMPDATLRKLIQNEMVAIQTRRKMERRKAEKTLKKKKKASKSK